MDYSFGASTATLFATPSPADRHRSALGSLVTPVSRPFSAAARPSPPTLPAPAAPALGTALASTAPSALSASAFATPSRPTTAAATTKAVRFFPAYAAFQPPSLASAGPPSRLQSYAPTRSPPASSPYLSSHAPLVQSTPTPPMSRAPAALFAVAPPPSLPPVGRAEVARKLRVNSVLLVIWWLSARTKLYSFASGHLVQLVPSLDTPLHVLEAMILLLLFYNICECLFQLNRLAALPTPASYRPSSPRLSPKRSPARSTFHTPVRASPKTRSSPSMSPSPTLARNSPASPFRASARASPSGAPTPQTPSSVPRMATALRHSTLPTSGSPSPKAAPEGDPSLLTAYFARHSPSSGAVSPSINSRVAIDRLLDE